MSLFGLFLTILLTGIPIAFAFALTGLLYMAFSSGTTLNFSSVVTVAFSGLDSFVLMSVPFFIFAGDLMNQGGIVKRLIRFSGLFTGSDRTAIGGITVLTSTFFGAISGSSAASVAAVGSVMVPEMERQGYKRTYAASLAAASGYIGILIPPSIPLILYGLASSASIGDLFLAGIGPGILVMITFVALNRWLLPHHVNPAQNAPREDSSNPSISRVIISAIPGLLLPILILGGIYSGIFTPTEAAAVAVAYSIVIGLFVYRSIKVMDIARIALGSAITSASIMIIIGFAYFFGRVMTMERIPAAILEFTLTLTDNPILLTLLVNVFLLLLGMFIETATVILLATPILLPLATRLGIDPVHFGVIMIMNLSVGLITPPMALNLFIASRTTNIPVSSLIIPILPFVIVSIVLLLVITFVPEVSTAIPSMFR